jgi:antitoxin (DNA-binding transcriptional repressor) of toxin-antitoxin stability system
MMFMMQSYEVKTKLADVLRKVEAGQEIAITRHGKIIARLSPWIAVNGVHDRVNAVERMRCFCRKRLLADESIAEMRVEGRR